MEAFSRYWGLLAKLAALLTGLVGMFLIQPPMLSAFDNNSETWLRMSQFLLAIIIGLFFLATKPDPALRTRWRTVAIIAAVAGVVLFFLYQMLLPSWSCSYVKATVMVGGEYRPIPKGYLAGHPGTTCKRMIELAGGHTEMVWSAKEILQRYIIICAVYTVALLSFSAAAMATVEYLRCSNVPPPPAEPGE